MSETLPTLSFDAVVRREHFAEFSKTFQKQLAHVGSGWLNGLVYLLPVFVLSLVFAEWASAAAVPRDPKAAFGPVEIAMLALVAGVLLSLFQGWLLARRQARAFNEGTLREGGSYLGLRRFTLDWEGITSEGDHGRALTRWSAVMQMTEAAETYLIWTDPGAAVLVPRDAFASDAEAGAFTAFVAERIARRGAIR